MTIFKIAARIAISAPLFIGMAVLPSAAQDDNVTSIKATVWTTDFSKELDFSCAVESQGVALGTFVTPNTLVIPKRLPDMSMTCTGVGYEPVKMDIRGGVPATIAPRFTAKAIS